MNPSPYATEADRIEARRRTFRESKARKTAERNRRKTAAEEWVTQLINQGTGPAVGQEDDDGRKQRRRGPS